MTKASSRPSRVLDSAPVLCYANVDKNVGYSGCTLLFVDGRELGRVPKLAICSEEASGGVLLFHCDDAWHALGCSAHKSIEAAKEKAEMIYPGLSSHWVKMKADP